MKQQYTPQQYLDAVTRHGGSRIKAAEELGVNIRTLMHYLKICKERGMEVPESPYCKDRAALLRGTIEDAHHAAPDGWIVKGTSALVGPDGELKQQWIKTDIDKERQIEILKNAILETFAS